MALDSKGILNDAHLRSKLSDWHLKKSKGIKREKILMPFAVGLRKSIAVAIFIKFLRYRTVTSVGSGKYPN